MSLPDKKRPRMLTPEELASAPKTQALMVDLIDRPEKAAAKVKGEVPQLQAGIIALFEALTECGTHAASLERALGAANRRADARAREACTFEKRTACSFASSATRQTTLEDFAKRVQADTVLKDQNTGYYMRLINVYKLWADDALGGPSDGESHG